MFTVHIGVAMLFSQSAIGYWEGLVRQAVVSAEGGPITATWGECQYVLENTTPECFWQMVQHPYP